MVELTFENPWVYVTTVCVTWIVIWVAVEMLFSDGDLLYAVVAGGAGGIASGILLFYVNAGRRGEQA